MTTKQRRRITSSMIGRSFLAMAGKVLANCEKCHLPFERLHQVGGQFVCDGCLKKVIK